MMANRLEGTMAAVGAGGRQNEIVYSLLKSEAPGRNVVFFGGDAVESQGHDVIERLSKPESIIRVLLDKFKSSNIWVITPARYNNSWACYDNFLPQTTMSGEPMGYNGREPRASSHLHALLHDILLKNAATASSAPQPPSKQSDEARAPVEGKARGTSGGEDEEDSEEENEWDTFIQSPFFSWSWVWKDPAGLREPLLAEALLGGDEGDADVENAGGGGDGGGRGTAGVGRDLESAKGVGLPPRDEGGISAEASSRGPRLQEGEAMGSEPGTVLVGFSKGGVVLNQILTEMAALEERLSTQTAATSGGPPDDKTLSADSSKGKIAEFSKLLAFTRSIEEVHYVDVGLNCRGAYVTDPQVLRWLVKSAIAQPRGLLLVFHGTPRQWADRNRRWIGQEKDRCVSLLRDAVKELGEPAERSLRVVERSYFDGERPSLRMHFKVIEAMTVE